MGCVDQIFILKQICEKAQEKKWRVYVGFYRFGEGEGLIGKLFGKCSECMVWG